MKKAISIVLCFVMLLAFAGCGKKDDGMKPVISYSFDKDEGLTLASGSLETDGDRKVLTLTGGGAANSGSYGASVKTDLFEKTDWTNGMTIAFWVKPATQDAAIAPLYSLGVVDHDAEGYIATTDSLELAINSDGNSGAAEYPRVWADPADVGPDAQPVLEAGKWQHIAVVLGSTGFTVYVDGVEHGKPQLGSSSANCKLFLDQIKYCYGLELGSWKCQWWGDIEAFEGSYDDFRIYNMALSAEEVGQVMKG